MGLLKVNRFKTVCFKGEWEIFLFLELLTNRRLGDISKHRLFSDFLEMNKIDKWSLFSGLF